MEKSHWLSLWDLVDILVDAETLAHLRGKGIPLGAVDAIPVAMPGHLPAGPPERDPKLRLLHGDLEVVLSKQDDS